MYSVPDPQKIAAPQLGDVGLGVTALQQLGGDVADFANIFPAIQPATIVEVRADADMVDTDFFYRIVDGIAEVFQRGFGFFLDNAV